MRLTLAGLLLVTATSATAQTALQLRWQLKDDVFEGEAASRAAFTKGATRSLYHRLLLQKGNHRFYQDRCNRVNRSSEREAPF